jgi:hypothetical protein
MARERACSVFPTGCGEEAQRRTGARHVTLLELEQPRDDEPLQLVEGMLVPPIRHHHRRR